MPKLTRRDFLRAGLGGLAAVSTLGLRGCFLGQKLRDLPNVLLISIDTLRADHVGCYGYSKDTTPNIDRLTEEGIIFENAISQSNRTLPSHISMMTSLYPETHRVLCHGGQDSGLCMDAPFTLNLSQKVITLAEILREQNYTTAEIVAVGLLGPKTNFSQGFSEVYPAHSRKPAERVNTEALRWFESFKNRAASGGDMRFFLFVHYFDPHSSRRGSKLPYDSPFNTRYCESYKGSLAGCDLSRMNQEGRALSKEDLEHLIALYDGGVAYADEYVGKLLDHLKDSGYLDKTLVIVTSDHGEQFNEHGNFLHNQVYKQEMHIPLIVKFPRGWSGRYRGTRISLRVRSIDIAPTILDVLGMSYEKMQGESFLPLIGRRTSQDRVAFSGVPRQHSIINSEGFKVIRDNVHGRLELYNLRDDPDEQKDLFPSIRADLSNRRVFMRLVSLIEDWREENARLSNELLGPYKDSDKGKTNPEIRKQLRALGYLN